MTFYIWHKLLLFTKNNDVCHCTGEGGSKRGDSKIPHGASVGAEISMRLLLFKIIIHGAGSLWKEVRKDLIVGGLRPNK